MKQRLVLTLVTLASTFLPRTACAQDEIPPLEQALGAAYLAKAELALLRGQLNRGRVYLAAAHEADPSISLFRLKALDMMYQDFPFLDDVVSGYTGGPAAFSMDGRFVAYTTRDSVLGLDLETSELRAVARPTMNGLRIEISPKGRFVALCDNMGNLVLCDMKRETQVGQFAFRRGSPPSMMPVRLSFSLDENTIVAHYRYSDEEAVYFLSTKDLSVLRTIPGISMGIGPIRFLADGSLLACPGARTALVDPSTMRIIKTLAPRTGYDVDYLPDRDLLAVGSSRRIDVFNSKTQEKIAEYQAASHNIVMVRFLGNGQYIAYASPNGESGIIDCTSEKPVQIFEVGRDAAVSPGRYLLLAQGKVIDLSACRPFQTNLGAKTAHATRPSRSNIPQSILKALTDTSERALIQSGGSIRLASKSISGNMEAYGTDDGRTFIYNRGKDQVQVFLTDHYRSPIDFAFFPDDSHFARLCASGNGQVGAVEVYSLLDGTRYTLRFGDPPVSVRVAPDLRIAVVLDRKNRVFLAPIPGLEAKVELLPATMTERQISVDRNTKTLIVKTGSEITSYDLNKMSEERTLPSYREATRRYGFSADLFEPSLGQRATPARVEPLKAEPVTSGTSTMDTAKPMVSRSAVERRTNQSTEMGPGQGDALPGDESNSHSCHLTPVHYIMGTIVNYYRPIRITLSGQPRERLHKEPEYSAEKPLYGTMELGDGEDRFVTIVVDEPEGGPERIYIDRNNDEDLTNDGEGAWSASSSSSSLRLSNVKIDVDYTTGQMPYTFTFYRFKTRLRDVVLYYRDSARQGEIVSGGETYKIAVLDENADGRFDDLDNGTLLIDLNQDGKLVGRSDSAERHELNKPFNIHGKVWSIDTMSADGSAIVLKPSTAEAEMRTYLEPGYPAPTFSGKDLEGNSIELSREARLAKYVLLDFWASWCGPCREEFPDLRRLHAGYSDRGLRILGINLDSKRDAAQQVVQENSLDYPHIFDGLGWKNAVAIQYRVSAIPQTYLLDSNLNIVAKNLRGAGLEQKIATLLGPANNEAIKAAEARRSESFSSRAEVPSRRPLARSDLSASASSLSRDGTLDDGFSIYLGVGNVNGLGKVIQLDGAGKGRGIVELPSTPYGLAYDSAQLWAALPGAKRVVSIDAPGRVDTVLDSEELKNPISVAVTPGNRDILVADNETDVLILLSRNHASEYKVIYRGTTPDNLQNISVAVTLDGFGLMGTSNPRGVYHFPLQVGISLGAPVLTWSGDVAADPTSTRWAVMQRRSLCVLGGGQEVLQLPLPAGYSSYRGGLLAFAPDGRLVVALATDGGVELCVADISEKTFGSLFRWSGERLVSLAVGQKMDWPVAQQMKPARAEGRNEEPVTPRNSLIAIPKEKLSLSSDMQGCVENLKKVYAAIKQYEKDKGKLPDWLSDLVPDYLSSETLFCPEDARHKSPYSPDPRLPCSYGWQFSAKPIPPGWDPTGRTLYRDWKIEQIKLFGDIVPMVRCYHHGSGRVLNLSAGGEIWWGPLDWEYMFMPDYASIHKQTISKAIASRSTDVAPPRAGPRQSVSLVGKLAHTFTLQDVNGKQVSLSDFKGKVVLLDFWATWCAPCRRSIPYLDALYRKYKDQGLVVIGLNHERDHDKVKEFANGQISYPVLLDADEQFKEYDVSGIPTAFYIGRNGTIQYQEVGFSPQREKEVEQKVRELLGIKGDMVAGPEAPSQEFSANAEGWKPPEFPDPREILREAQADARAQRYEDALAKHVWFHQNALKYRPSLSGVRRSFALSYWHKLGMAYPPALDKLKEIRDEAAKNVVNGTNFRESFRDLVAINRTVGEEYRTKELFVLLDAQNPDVAKKVFDSAQPALIKAEEYKLCGKYIDPRRSFPRMIESFRRGKQLVEGGRFGAEFLDFTNKNFTNDATTLIALLTVNGRKAEAEEIAEDAKKEWNNALFHAAIDKALEGEVPKPWP